MPKEGYLLEGWLPEERLSATLGLCKRHFCGDRKKPKVMRSHLESMKVGANIFMTYILRRLPEPYLHPGFYVEGRCFCRVSHLCVKMEIWDL